MTPEQAPGHHAVQINVLRQKETDMITGLALNYPNEAVGPAQTAKEVGMPVLISFTVENDDNWITWSSIKGAIELVDHATNTTTISYMVNRARPMRFALS